METAWHPRRSSPTPAAELTTQTDLPDPVMRLIAGWLADQESPHTRNAYARDVAGITQAPQTGNHQPPRPMLAPPWLQWCEANNVHPLTATPDHVAFYARMLETSGLASTSRARKLAAISSWYTHLERRQVIATSPAVIKRPKISKDVRVGPGLTRTQAHTLIETADTDPGPERARTSALIATLLLTGARVSEATTATTADLGVSLGHRVLWVTRKGGKRQPLALPGPAAARIDTYLAGRPDLAALPVRVGTETAPTRTPLFVTTRGNRVLPAEVWKLVRRLGARAGFPPDLVRRLGPHALRATFITLSLDAGAALRDVQDAAGHASSDMTRSYDRSREVLDRAPGWQLAAYLTGSPSPGD